MGEAIAKGILKTFNIEYMGEIDMRFKDVPEQHWAYKAIEELAERGIINGYPDGSFRPDESVTRAEIATIMSKFIKD